MESVLRGALRLRCCQAASQVVRGAGVCLRRSACAFHVLPGDCTVGDIDLSKDDIKFYHENGYIRVPQLLGSAQLKRWRAAVDEAVEQREESPLSGTQFHTTQGEEYDDKVFVRPVNLWKTHEPLAKLLSSAKEVIGRMACQLEGIEGVRVWHDQALYKPPYANPTSWHVDAPYCSFTSPNGLSVWIALDDATPDNGCMYYLPGSHKVIQSIADREGEYREVPITKDMDTIFTELPELFKCEADPDPIYMNAGDCTFHNGRTVHAATPNMTARHRRAMTIQMMPIGSTFNGKQSVLTQEQFESLKIGDSLDNDKHHPLMYKCPSEKLKKKRNT